MAVGRGADADGEQPPGADAMMQQLEQRLFIADLAVGEKDDLLEPRTILRALERLSQGGEHFGSTVGRELFGIADGLFDRRGRDRLRSGEERPDAVVELNDV